MPFTPDSFGSSAGPPCDCLPPLMEFNLPPPPDPSMFMALDRDFSFSCDQSDNFTPNIHISPDLQQPPYAYHLTEYLTFGISAALAFVLCITVAVLALFYCYRYVKVKL